MSANQQIHEILDSVAKVLWNCFLFGFLLLLLWFVLFALAPGVIRDVHGPLFDLSSHEISVIHYCGMGFVKLCVLLLFLFPYLSIRLVLRNAPR